jgi:hypothetical protein
VYLTCVRFFFFQNQKITCTFLKWKSSSVRAIAEPVIRKPAPPTIEECKAAVVAGNPPPAPPVPGKPKAPEGTPVITPLVYI